MPLIFQPDELEYVEVKGRAQILECSTEYLHFNFLVKRMDGTTKLFFAEINAYCRGEKDVYLCTPLEQSDCGMYICIVFPSIFCWPSWMLTHFLISLKALVSGVFEIETLSTPLVVRIWLVASIHITAARRLTVMMMIICKLLCLEHSKWEVHWEGLCTVWVLEKETQTLLQRGDMF